MARWTAHLTIVAFVVGAACLALPGQTQPLAFSIETAKTTYELGEPILIAVIADNPSAQAVETVFHAGFTGPRGLLTFEVVGPGGQVIPYEGDQARLSPPGFWPRYRVPPHGYLIKVVDLLDAYHLTQPGVYRLRATYRMPFQPNPAEKANDFPHALPAEVTSNELTIYVLPTVYDPGLQPRPRAMEVRGERVEQGAPKVIEHGPGPNVIERGPAQPLALSIATDRTTCELGEPVLIALIADNPSAQVVETVFNPVFSGPAPTGLLTFEVIGPGGQALPYEGEEAQLSPPGMWSRYRVPPHGSLIKVVNLLDAYHLKQPGLYLLRATYRMPFQRDPAKPGFDFPHALPAEVTSNELTITVLPTAYVRHQAPQPGAVEARGQRMEQGTCLAPLRGLAYHLGAAIVGNGDQGSAELMASGGARVSVAAGRREASANGQPLRLVMAPRSMDGDLIVPLRSVAEALGAKVIWDDAQSRAYIMPRA